jgi:hypothetical protein
MPNVKIVVGAGATCPARTPPCSRRQRAWYDFLYSTIESEAKAPVAMDEDSPGDPVDFGTRA